MSTNIRYPDVLATQLISHRSELSYRLADVARLQPRWAKHLDSSRDDYHDLVITEFAAQVDYLAHYFRHNDRYFMRLYASEKQKQLYEAGLSRQSRWDLSQSQLNRDIEAYRSILQTSLPDSAWCLLEDRLNHVKNILCGSEHATHFRVLLVGDCLFLDVVAFLTGGALEDSIIPVFDFASSKDVQTLKKQVAELSGIKYDLILVSPYTYAFSPEYAALQNKSILFKSQSFVEKLVQATIEPTRGLLLFIAELFECPIYVHNAGTIIRENSIWWRWLKNKLTARPRRVARQYINTYLKETLVDINRLSFKHLFQFDEASIRQEYGEHQLGRYFYRAPLQHPAYFGAVVGERYRDIFYVHAHLARKKIIVCDLDNTLWRGEIGEGVVAHYADRQRALMMLKSKGVLLAINSKNDPLNVRWHDAILTEEDFVYSDINWDPKTVGIRRIEQALNLRTRDYIFLDDRADERFLMNEEYPEIHCLDPNDERVWRFFDLWAKVLSDDMTMDRTQMYQERISRQAYLDSFEETDEERKKRLKSLDIKLNIRRATRSDLKRTAELINRTNQFNLQGSKTTLREVEFWYNSNYHTILLCDSSDRFGDMGITCIAILKKKADRVEIPIFVLSCRVFGYGIENTMIEHIMEFSKVYGDVITIIGFVVETTQNGPCKDFYKKNGFRQNNGEWQFDLFECREVEHGEL